MQLSDLQFDLPEQFIAQSPAEPRDTSRLLVLHRDDGRIEHRKFHDIVEYFRPHDCLTLNDTRVIPARFYCRKSTGGRIEGLYLHRDGDLWRVLLKPAARLKLGQLLHCDRAPCQLELREQMERGQWKVRPIPDTDPFDFLHHVGQTPLPPYIHRDNTPDDRDAIRYQTVYARHPGAVAAPTAGLHFTRELLERIRVLGVRTADVTLHVGIGTFAPITVEDVSKHEMHAEFFDAQESAIETLVRSRDAGGRLFAVGTTSVRVLESLPLIGDPHQTLKPQSGWTSIFIHPPYRFHNVDCLITNFHLPGSSLIALVMAFAGQDLIRSAYTAAIEHRYRFYSYGDAMLII